MVTIFYFQISLEKTREKYTFVVMENKLIGALSDFLESYSISYETEGNSIFTDGGKLRIDAVDLSDNNSVYREVTQSSEVQVIRVYEDLWHTRPGLIKNRLLGIFGFGESIFARKCELRSVSPQEASRFLNENHLLGSSSCKYRYGLFYNNILYAVATFSAPRPMNRDGVIVGSYEWVRYASKGSSRVLGGMGRLLSCFVRECNPGEIMSYADKDWSEGNAYIKLGFKLTGETAPIRFFVNSETNIRISEKKLVSDKKFRNYDLQKSGFVSLFNSGNLKFIRSFATL